MDNAVAWPGGSPAAKVLLVGLGNPGAGYAATRHNAGFVVVEALAERWGVRFTQKRFQGAFAEGALCGRPALWLLPQTFMNRSGQAVGPAAGFYKLAPSAVVVVHDELEIPFGRLRLKQGGGHGGHNGLRSIDGALPSKDTFRVRVGIGRPAQGDVSSYVLAPFSAEERTWLPEVVDAACDAVESLLREGLAAAQNRAHPLELVPAAPR